MKTPEVIKIDRIVSFKREGYHCGSPFCDTLHATEYTLSSIDNGAEISLSLTVKQRENTVAAVLDVETAETLRDGIDTWLSTKATTGERSHA